MLSRAEQVALAKPLPDAESRGPLVASSVLQLIGNTPLVEINRVRDGVAPGVRFYA
jgi:hypothetical protein